MQRIDTADAANSLPTPAALGAPGYFTDGNPVGPVPATTVSADWLNMVQEELAYVVEQPGGTLSKTNHTQLYAAIQALIAAGAAAYNGAVRSSASNLKASATGTNATVVASADEISVENGSNQYATLRAVSVTINTAGAAGADSLDTGTLAVNTWYSVWIIYDPFGLTTAGLISLSATAPTLPSGYTHKARIGWIRTDGSAKYPLGFTQRGRSVAYLVAAGGNVAALPQIAGTGSTGSVSTPTWTAKSVANFVPTTAAKIALMLTSAGSGGLGQSMAAPNNAYGAYNSNTNPPPVVCTTASTPLVENLRADMLLEGSSIYYASTGDFTLWCVGWEDNF